MGISPLTWFLDHPFYLADILVLLFFLPLRTTFSTNYYIQNGNELHTIKEGIISLIQANFSISLSLGTPSKQLCQ